MTLLPLEINENDRIAVIAPHPDDECIGVGGVMAKYHKQCDIYVISDGSHGNKEKSTQQEKRIRHEQFVNEMEYIGVNKYFWLGYEDGTLINQLGCLDSINLKNYDIIFIPFGQDNHPDHMAVFSLVIEKLKNEKLHKIKVFQYEVHSPMHYCTHFLDISEELDKKVKLISFHKDQMNYIPYNEMAKHLALYRAGQLGIVNGACENYYLTDIDSVEISKEEKAREIAIAKKQMLFELFNLWTRVLSKRKICEYFSRHNFSTVSIYGYSDAGKSLYEQLCEPSLNVIDIFDKRLVYIPEKQCSTILPSEGNRDVDIVVITVIGNISDIVENLYLLSYKRVISINEILNEMICYKKLSC